MSHIDSVTPAGPLVIAPGGSVDIDVFVSGVPGDDSAVVRFGGSDAASVSVSITVDRDALEGVLGSSAEPSQVFGELVTGPGSLSSFGPITGGWRYRFVAV